jgi:hypothetical protein
MLYVKKPFVLVCFSTENIERFDKIIIFVEYQFFNFNFYFLTYALHNKIFDSNNKVTEYGIGI